MDFLHTDLVHMCKVLLRKTLDFEQKVHFLHLYRDIYTDLVYMCKVIKENCQILKKSTFFAFVQGYIHRFGLHVHS